MSLLTRGWGGGREEDRGLTSLPLVFQGSGVSWLSRSLTPPSLGLEPGRLSEEEAVARSLLSGSVLHFFVPWSLRVVSFQMRKFVQPSHPYKAKKISQVIQPMPFGVTHRRRGDVAAASVQSPFQTV